jgi:polynucleotide 5'-kinase involved in rRNA processing
MALSRHDVSPDIAGLAEALDGSRPALVLGGADTGKTTLVRQLAGRWTSQGLRVALLCADPGQPLIGLPGTLSLTLLTGGAEGARPDRVAFVGSHSSHHCQDDLLLALARLLREAVRLAPDRVLIDTCGLVHGPAGVSLKQREVDLCAPAGVLALRRGEELEPILFPFERRADVSLRRLTPSPQVQRKTPAQRRQNRRGRFVTYFSHARRRAFRWRVACEDIEGRLCGLTGKEGWTAGLGILCEVAPERQEVTCWTPLPEETEVTAVQVGSLALDPSGEELGIRGRSPVRYVS